MEMEVKLGCHFTFRFPLLNDPTTEYRFFSGLSRANKNIGSVSFCQCTAAPKLFLFLFRVCTSQRGLT